MPKFNFASMAQYVVKNPFTAAAAVFTPLFAKNEDRGYFRTALITTPVVFATGAVVPKLFGGVRDFGIDVAREATGFRNVLQKAEKWTRYEQPNFNNLKTIFQDPSAGANTIERLTSAYLVAERRGHRDFLKEQRVLSKLFNRRFVKTNDLIGKADLGDLKSLSRIREITQLQETKGQLISNAMRISRRSSLTPTELAEESGMIERGVLSNEAMIEMFDKYSNRPEFVKTLRNRLRELKKLEYGGTLLASENVAPGVKTSISSPIDFDFDDWARNAISQYVPSETIQNLEMAQKQGKIQAVRIETELSDAVVSGKTGRVLNLRVTRREGKNLKELLIPVVDPVTGTVSMPGGRAAGVGDLVIGPDQKPYELSTWISKQMVENPGIPIESTFPGGPSLQGEVAAHAYWQVGDPLDAWRMSELAAAGEEGAGEFSAQARKLRSFAAKVTTLPVFMGEEGERATFSQLSHARQVATIREMFNTGRYINMGSEAGTYEGRLVLREAASLSPWGAPSAEKQDPIWRSITKEWQLRRRPGTRADFASPNWLSSSWEGLTGADTIPSMRLTAASIAPQDRALFAELPATLDELHFQRAQITQRFIDRGMSGQNAAAMYNDIYGMYQSGQQESLRNFGAMGENVTMMKPEFAENFQVEGTRTYRMDEVGVKEGQSIGENTVLGFRDSDRVIPIGQGVVTDIAKTDEGFMVNVRHGFGMQGAKLDIAGVKGMNRVVTSNEHFEQMRDIANKFYQRMGSEDFIPEGVNVLAPAEYFANKVEPAHAYMGIASDLVTRLSGTPAEPILNDYLSRMSAQGIDFAGGQMRITAPTALGDTEASQRVMALAKINEDFFRQAGEALKTAGGYHDPVLDAFVHHGKDLGNWMLKNQFNATAFAWDHSLVNAPHFATITHDVATYMMMGGNVASLKAIQSRMQTVSGGNARQALDFAKQLFGGETSGEAVPLNEAFLLKGDLQSAEFRAGSILDPSIARYKKNFKLDLGGGVFVPVPGTEAYGAESPQFDIGKYQTTPWQHTLQELAFEKNPEAQAALRERLMSQYKEAFATGKHSAFRPHAYDPMGVSGVLGTAAEQGDPFVARLSPNVVKNIRSQRLREALMRGEEVVGALHRQPTNFMPFLKYRMDPALEGTKEIAVSERISRLMYGDVDKDSVNALLFDANLRMEGNKMIVEGAANQIERDAAQEALDSIQGGKQEGILAAMEEVLGTSEVSRLNTDFAPKSLFDRAQSFAKSVAERTRVAINRTAGATIGPYSNVLTEITEHMARNPVLLRDPAAAARLNAITFGMIRQAPIAARKAHATFSMETAMQKLGQLKRAVSNENPYASAEALQSTFLSLGKTLHGEDWVTKNEFQYLSSAKAAEDFKQWAVARTEKGRLAKQALTSSIRQDIPFEQQSASKNLERIFASDIESVLGPHHGGKAARESATMLGQTAEFLAERGRATAETATGRIGRIFAEHSGKMAIGLGVLAGLGIALTPRRPAIATFSRGSGNKFRPDERMGVADNIPGEPVPGEMAPSMPPRRIIAGSPGVRTGIVAPIAQTSDLSVHMRATDHSRAAETARQLAMIPGSGATNVTVNYRDRTKLRSLRTRERIRQINA